MHSGPSPSLSKDSPVQKEQNYYQALSLPTSATAKQIREAYVRLKHTYSSDSLAAYSLLAPEENAEILEQIETAYEILSSPEKKLAYDKHLNINVDFDQKNEGAQYSSNEKQNTAHLERDELQSRESISPIMAKNRFKLDYDLNPQFEEKIESAVSFTGSFLKEIREYKNVSLERLSDLTKISKSYLKFIENEEVDKLPANVFIRGFVYQYAKCLRLSPDIVATSYLNHLKNLKGKKKNEVDN